jgi:hypothetical protein
MPSGPSDFAALAAFPASNEQCASRTVEVALLQREGFADPQPGAPEQHDQRAESMAVRAVPNGAHHGDDLLNRWRVGWVLLALIAWCRPR